MTGTFLLPDWGGCSLVKSSRPTFIAKNVDSQLKVRSQERNNKLKTDGNMYYKFNRAACSENCKGDIMLNLFTSSPAATVPYKVTRAREDHDPGSTLSYSHLSFPITGLKRFSVIKQFFVSQTQETARVIIAPADTADSSAGQNALHQGLSVNWLQCHCCEIHVSYSVILPNIDIVYLKQWLLKESILLVSCLVLLPKKLAV